MNSKLHAQAEARPAIGWSFRVGRWLGIDLYVHVTFLLLLGFIALSHWTASRSLMAAWQGVLFMLGLFGCVLLHEYGHALAARRYGIGTRDITLLPIGGLARLERMPEKPLQELVVALAGPAVNVVIAIALFIGLWAGGHAPVSAVSVTGGNLLERLLVANVFLVLFNLLPAFPMDGGRVLRSLLALKLNPVRATRIAARIGKGMAVLFGFAGLFGNPMLLLIALFVWIGAAQESAAAEMKSSLVSASVGDAMLTDFKTLAPEHTVGEAARLLLAGSQHDFPVVSGGAVIGMLTHAELFAALRTHGEGALVGNVMKREFAAVSAHDALDRVLTADNLEKGLAMPVLSSGRLVGLLTAENVGEFFMIRAALQGQSRRTTPPPLPPMNLPPRGMPELPRPRPAV